MLERQRRVGNPSSSVSSRCSPIWGSWNETEVQSYLIRDNYASDSYHSSAFLPCSDPLGRGPAVSPPLIWPSRAPSRPPSRAITRETSSRTPTRAFSLACSDLMLRGGPVRRRRGSIVLEEDLLETYPLINTRASGFKFGGKTYLLTYSQIGEISNSALEDKFNRFGN